MSAPAALVKTDLSHVVIAGDGKDAWSALQTPEVDTRQLRQRADESARWIARHPNVKRRLAAIVLDVDDTICTWLRVPSLAGPVVGAALRTQSQEWGAHAPTASFEPLTDDARPARSSVLSLKKKTSDNADSTTGEPVALICIPDALVRLWLDELDVQGVRTGPVYTLWHAMAHTWGEKVSDQAASAIVLVDPAGRLIWAWTRGKELLTGGLAMLRPTYEQSDDAQTMPRENEDESTPRSLALHRMGLDWLTWSAHLGMSPERVLVVGPGASDIASAMSERWKNLTIDADDSEDAIAHALRTIAAAAETSPTSSRFGLTKLSRRPTRATRWQFRWTAAAMLALAIALSLIGQRLGDAASKMIRTQSAVRQQTRDEARRETASATITDIATNEDIVNSVNSTLQSMKVEPFRPPPPPRPIYEELARVMSILRKYDGARLAGIALEQEIRGGPKLQARLPDRRTATEVADALNSDGAKVRWTRRTSGGDLADLNLDGKWSDE